MNAYVKPTSSTDTERDDTAMSPTPDCGKQRGACDVRVGIVTTHPDVRTLRPEDGHYAANCCGSDRCIGRHQRTAQRIARRPALFVADRGAP